MSRDPAWIDLPLREKLRVRPVRTVARLITVPWIVAYRIAVHGARVVREEIAAERESKS